MEKFFLIDGSALFYRSYFAFIRNPLINSKGENTSAAFGFTTSILRILKNENPNYIAVIFDTPAPTFRHQLYDQYKINRPKMPPEMAVLIPRVKEIALAFNIPLIELPGYEADDIIGTFASMASKEDVETYIVTGDKDLMQLVNPKIKIYNLRKAGRELEIYDEKAVEEKMGVQPQKIIDMLALMGDTSDNIPGVQGIGEKTASLLLKEFGSFENIFKNLDKIKSDSLRKKLKSGVDIAKLSYKLATINTNTPIGIDFHSLKVRDKDNKKLRDIFVELEFTSLMKELDIDNRKDKHSYNIVKSRKEFDKFLELLSKQKIFSFGTFTTSIDSMRTEIIGFSFSFYTNEAYYIHRNLEKNEENSTLEQDLFSDTDLQDDLDYIIKKLKPVMENSEIKKCGHNIKYDMLVMSNYGVEIKGIEFDTMIASYLINPGRAKHTLEAVGFEYLNYKKTSEVDLVGSGKNQISLLDVPIEKISNYICENVDIIFRLKKVLETKISEAKVEKLFYEIEMPLVRVLMEIEKNGVFIDIPFLKEMSKSFEAELKKLEKEIHEIAEEKFNINSTQQVGKILFDKLKVHETVGIKKPKKTKMGNYSTDVSVLESLSSHPIAQKLLNYRELSKLKSTYIDALPELVNPKTNRIHTSYNQTVVSTGRLSSSEPNLQNIPVRTETGKEIRRAFIPEKKSNVILSADYSQIELRILAHISGDKNLREAFIKEEDIHQSTASKIFSVRMNEVTSEMRRYAKAINFGIIYGMEAFGLAWRVGMTNQEAQRFITNYFATYPGVSEYIQSTLRKAHSEKYVTTLLNRRLYLENIDSLNLQMRKAIERVAINMPIQGSAADMIKIAMVKIADELRKGNYKTKMIMQVHDELVFEVPKNEFEEIKEIVKTKMETAMKLDVPVKVDIGVGENWLEAH